jgi:hypothetical protein
MAAELFLGKTDATLASVTEGDKEQKSAEGKSGWRGGGSGAAFMEILD